jgi:hypothetical protein
MENLYKELHDCENRSEYLKMLAEKNGIDIHTVYAIADMLGPSEDFDGLVSSLEDIACEGNYFN